MIPVIIKLSVSVCEYVYVCVIFSNFAYIDSEINVHHHLFWGTQEHHTTPKADID